MKLDRDNVTFVTPDVSAAVRRRWGWSLRSKMAPAFVAAFAGLAIVLAVSSGARATPKLAFDASGTPKAWQYSNVQFPNKRDGFMLATHTTSVLLTTTNGGHTWTKRSIPSGGASWFQFVNGSDGWLVDSPHCLCSSVRFSLYRTVDGGRTWQFTLGLGKEGPRRIQFVSPTQGWLQHGGNYGQTLETLDGGRTWHRVHWPFATYFQWQFQNTHIGWVITTGPPGLAQIYMTVSGGRTWIKRPSQPGNYTMPAFANESNGWMVVTTLSSPNACNQCAEQVKLLQTRDGGRSWLVEHSVDTGVSGMGRPPHGPYWMGGWAWQVDQPQFVDARHGWMLFGGWNGRASPPAHWFIDGGVTTTANGGKTWRMHRLNFPASAQAFLAPVSGREAWLAVEDIPPPQGPPELSNLKNIVLHTTDGGRHWNPVEAKILVR